MRSKLVLKLKKRFLSKNLWVYKNAEVHYEKNDNQIYQYKKGTYKVRNEIETKRNEIDENETKRNQRNGNETNENKTKQTDMKKMEGNKIKDKTK